MTEGTYWDGKRFISKDEMIRTRRLLRAKPNPRHVKAPPPKEKPDDDQKDAEQLGRGEGGGEQ